MPSIDSAADAKKVALMRLCNDPLEFVRDDHLLNPLFLRQGWKPQLKPEVHASNLGRLQERHLTSGMETHRVIRVIVVDDDNRALQILQPRGHGRAESYPRGDFDSKVKPANVALLMVVTELEIARRLMFSARDTSIERAKYLIAARS